jgi:hypothetical protein
MSAVRTVDQGLPAVVLSGLHMAECVGVDRWVPLKAVERALRLRGDRAAAEAAEPLLAGLVAQGKAESAAGRYRRRLER